MERAWWARFHCSAIAEDREILVMAPNAFEAADRVHEAFGVDGIEIRSEPRGKEVKR